MSSPNKITGMLSRMRVIIGIRKCNLLDQGKETTGTKKNITETSSKSNAFLVDF